MPASRIVQLLAATALLVLVFAAPPAHGAPGTDGTAGAQGAERIIVLNGGKAWAVHTVEGLEVLPAPAGNIALHRAVTTAEGRMAVGVERVSGSDLADTEGTSERLVLLRVGIGSGELERLPAPKQEHDAMVYAPTLLLDKGVLTGLLWIEGFAPNKTRVRAADRTGSGWSQPISVSDFGPGTQIALEVARLTGGSRIAVWAAFDGEDDEIVWSRSSAGLWSKPRPVTANQVPDVTPTLHATAEGALLAWSGYDGNDYRIHVARLEGETWSAPTLLEGRGSVWPVFETLDASNAVLTWRQAVPRTWMVAAVDGAQTIQWMAPAPQPMSELAGRPMASNQDGAIRLLWPVAPPAKVALAETLVLAETMVRPPAD